MRTLMILAPLAALVLASCTSSSSGAEEAAATPEDAYRALDEMALDLFTEIAPGTEVKSPEPSDPYGCGGPEGVDDTKVRQSYVLAVGGVPDPRASLDSAPTFLEDPER